MPYSYPDCKDEVKKHIQKYVDTNLRILDVGPGSGTYARLLYDYKMDALEIHEPYIKMFDLNRQYSTIHIGDVRSFDLTKYDYIILGDIVEHLSLEDAKNLFKKIKGIRCLVGVPYNFEQGPEFGNVYETHLQADLTEDIVVERFGLFKLCGSSRYGYFVNYRF